jgi:DNA-binding LacI/PurR family transcriptional regulator
MSHFAILSPARQVAEHLRSGIEQQRWIAVMPGTPQLAKELGVDRKTVESAMVLLQEEGCLRHEGAGKRRKILLQSPWSVNSMRVAILLGEDSDRRSDYVMNLYRDLNEAGHAAFYASRYLFDMGMCVKKVERLVKRTEADAWVVVAGSREVLEWFSRHGKPAFALFGRRRGLPIAAAGPDKLPAMEEIMRHLIHLGHKRIVMMVRPSRRNPTPGAQERTFLRELAAHHLAAGDYNLPGWEDHKASYFSRLEKLFAAAPPTALIVDEVSHLIGTVQFLASKKIRVPEDVSLVCTDYSAALDWCEPEISHIRWDSQPVVRRILRWANNISQGKTDIRQMLTPGTWHRGGTIAPVARHHL